jgi:hypothetical protein
MQRQSVASPIRERFKLAVRKVPVLQRITEVLRCAREQKNLDLHTPWGQALDWVGT